MSAPESVDYRAIARAKRILNERRSVLVGELHRIDRELKTLNDQLRALTQPPLFGLPQTPATPEGKIDEAPL